MTTLITLFHKENLRKTLTALATLILWVAAHAGTLPAPFDQYSGTIQSLAALIGALNLVHIDPKQEL